VARIVRQMLGLYRHSEQIGAVDINAVIDDTLALFTRQLERAGIEVQKELGQVPAIVGSGDQMRQLLSNLVVNAKDSMAAAAESNGNVSGRYILRLRTRHLPARDGIHGWVRILVADNGTGIRSEILKTVFEPFVTTKGEKGTGLGLWIVKGIVDNHGGRMRLRSQLGKGTTFKIDLPVVR
jgi:signal transduction histidine kinase